MTDKLEANAAAMKRWRTRLKRAINMIDKLEKQQKRLVAATIKRDIAAMTTATEPVLVPPPAPVPAALAPPDNGIPDFLRRGIAAQRTADEVVAEVIKAEQEAKSKAKARGRIEKMKAAKRGDLKKMPLTGKAALAAIRAAEAETTET